MKMSIKVVDDYEVSMETLAFKPAFQLDFYTIVIEMHQVIAVRKTPIELMKSACLDGGASYEGRRKAVLHKLGTINKAPIPVDPLNLIYAIPTHAPNHPNCIWLFFQHIKYIQEDPKNKGSSLVYFPNHIVVPTTASRATLLKQIERTSLCVLSFSNILTLSPI